MISLSCPPSISENQAVGCTVDASDPDEPADPLTSGRDAQTTTVGAIAATGEPDEPTIGERASELVAVSMDMGEGYAKSVREHAPQAAICIDNYHVVQLATKALDEVRRERWNELRGAGDKHAA